MLLTSSQGAQQKVRRAVALVALCRGQVTRRVVVLLERSAHQFRAFTEHRNSNAGKEAQARRRMLAAWCMTTWCKPYRPLGTPNSGAIR